MTDEADRREAMLNLHRDANGDGLLVGPDCPACGQRRTVVYRCTGCGEVWEVPGVFRWSWQGKGHWHDADAGDEWRRATVGHWQGHRAQGEQVMIVPVREPTT